MKEISTNQELYEYLLDLAAELKQRGANDLSGLLLAATAQASGLSTEFLGESRSALKRVLTTADGVLTKQDCTEMQQVLKRLEDALNRK